MKKQRDQNLIAGVLFILTAIINFLNIDYSVYVWMDFAPAILATVAGILFVREALKSKKEQSS